MSESTVGRLEFTLARRFAGQGPNRFARFVTWVSFLGLALGVLVLTLVVTVMNGFDNELKSRLLQAVPHITIAGAKSGDAIRTEAAALPGVTSVHPYFQGIAAISAAGEVQPVTLYGVNSASASSLQYIQERMVQGALPELFERADAIVLGAPLARYLALLPGDPVIVVAVQTQGESVAPKILRFNLAGLFELGAEPDYGLALINTHRLSSSELSGMGTLGLQVQVQDPLNARRIAQQIDERTEDFAVDSWERSYGELFQAVQLEKSMMFVLLLLVVAIAAFNIVAGQTMLVNDKRASIAILRTMGAREALIRRVFMLQGIYVGVGGTLIGLVLGVLAALNINAILDWVQAITGMHLLDGSFFVEVPVLVKPTDLMVIAGMSCGLSILSAWVPARRAAALDPVQALH